MERGSRALGDLPVVLVLSLILSSAVLAIGVVGIQVARRVCELEDAHRDLQRFEEAVRAVSSGTLSVKRITLGSPARIELENHTAVLRLHGRTISSLHLPLPVLQPAVLSSGTYEIRLGFENNRWVLSVEAA
jgi:hypothetical protein